MSKRNTTADERLSEHARYLANVLAEHTADEPSLPTSTDCETVAHLWLLGSYRTSTLLRPPDDVDVAVNLAECADPPSPEVLRRLWTVFSSEGGVGHTSRACDVAHRHHAEPGNAAPVELCSGQAVDEARREQFRQLVRQVKWITRGDHTPDPNCALERYALGTRRPPQAEIEILLLLLAASSPDGAGNSRCSENVALSTPAAELADAVDGEHQAAAGDAITRAWRVASQRYQRTLDTVRLLDQSSLGTARSRASRRQANPRAVQEVLKRANVGSDHGKPGDPAA